MENSISEQSIYIYLDRWYQTVCCARHGIEPTAEMSIRISSNAGNQHTSTVLTLFADSVFNHILIRAEIYIYMVLAQISQCSTSYEIIFSLFEWVWCEFNKMETLACWQKKIYQRLMPNTFLPSRKTDVWVIARLCVKLMKIVKTIASCQQTSTAWRSSEIVYARPVHIYPSCIRLLFNCALC